MALRYAPHDHAFVPAAIRPGDLITVCLPGTQRPHSSEGWPVVLSYGLWNDRFGADPQIVGKQITVSNVPVTVVGVAPPDFRGIWPGDEIKMYLPLQFLNILANEDLVNSPVSFLRVAATGWLKPGVTI